MTTAMLREPTRRLNCSPCNASTTRSDAGKTWRTHTNRLDRAVRALATGHDPRSLIANGPPEKRPTEPARQEVFLSALDNVFAGPDSSWSVQ